MAGYVVDLEIPKRQKDSRSAYRQVIPAQAEAFFHEPRGNEDAQSHADHQQ